MSLPESIPAKIQGESPSASVPASLFDSFCFRGQRMKITQRLKRVAKPRLPIPAAEPDDDRRVGTSRRSKTTRLRAKPKPQLQPQPRLHASPLSDNSFGKMEILPLHFFQIDALDLAPRLLGKFLRRDDVVLQITEVNFHSPLLFQFHIGLLLDERQVLKILILGIVSQFRTALNKSIVMYRATTLFAYRDS